MNIERFNSVIRSGHKEDAAEVPFDPSRYWSITSQQLEPGRLGFPVTGTINGVPLQSAVVSRSGKFWLLLPSELEAHAHVSVGDSVVIELAPNKSFKPNALRSTNNMAD